MTPESELLARANELELCKAALQTVKLKLITLNSVVFFINISVHIHRGSVSEVVSLDPITLRP